MGAILFLLLGAKIIEDPAVSGPFVGGDLQFLYEEARVCALDILYPLKQASYFVCKTCFPHRFCCGILDKMPVLQSGTCVFVNYRAREVVSGKLAYHHLMYRECISNGRGCACCGRNQPWHECVRYYTVDQLHCELPELAPGDGLGFGWLHIVAAGRALCNDGYQGGIKCVNNIFDHSRGW